MRTPAGEDLKRAVRVAHGVVDRFHEHHSLALRVNPQLSATDQKKRGGQIEKDLKRECTMFSFRGKKALKHSWSMPATTPPPSAHLNAVRQRAIISSQSVTMPRSIGCFRVSTPRRLCTIDPTRDRLPGRRGQNLAGNAISEKSGQKVIQSKIEVKPMCRAGDEDDEEIRSGSRIQASLGPRRRRPPYRVALAPQMHSCIRLVRRKSAVGERLNCAHQFFRVHKSLGPAILMDQKTPTMLSESENAT